MSDPANIRLGLCCINTQLREQRPPVFASRTMVLRTVADKGFREIQERAKQNLRDMLTIMKWNNANGIRLYRMSSEMFPHISNPSLLECLTPEEREEVRSVPYSIEFAMPILKSIASWADYLEQRLTFHPGQYNQLGSPNPDVVEHTRTDLTAHAMIMDALELPTTGDRSGLMVVHGGGVYLTKGGDERSAKRIALDRWIEQWKRLPPSIQSRLVLENCEKGYCVEDLLPMCTAYGIPLVFDIHHYECYNHYHPRTTQATIESLMPQIHRTWGQKRQKMHISNQGTGAVGHHSDYIESIPDVMWNWSAVEPFDLMIEAKQKERAILRLYEQYPELRQPVVEY